MRAEVFKELHGDIVSNKIEEEVKSAVQSLSKEGVEPKLALIRASEDAGQVFYESAILKHSKDYGIETQAIKFGDGSTQTQLEVALQALNEDESVHGIIMLRPLPENYRYEKLRNMLNPAKDVDAITDNSIAELFAGKKDAFYACTAEACMEILSHYGIGVDGKRVTIIGRSLTAGKPLAVMMMNEHATVTVCHSHTPREDQIKACRDADIVALATGNILGYGSEFFRDGQVVLDIGTGVGPDGKMHGDLNIDEIKASGEISELTYTPVPGGLGAVTTAVLLRNILKAVGKGTEIRLERND